MFTLTLPSDILFGAGTLQELPGRARRFGTRIALARGGASFERPEVGGRVLPLLQAAGLTIVTLPLQTREPEPADIDAAVDLARSAGAHLVIAVGGGSVLDLGKAVAALAGQREPAPVRAYLEGIGDGRTLIEDPLPFLAVPTTAGTGTEATKNAVISSQRDGFKKSLRDPRMLATVALIDPTLACGLPAHLTAWTGLDALTQLIEAYTTRKANPVTDALALRGLSAARALPAAVQDSNDLAAREAMALAALLSGLCLANAGLGAAHGIAAALGSVSPIGHGLACALALPWVMAANLPVVAPRYAELATLLTGHTFPDAQTGGRAAIARVWELLSTLAIPRARDLPTLAGVLDDAQLPRLATLCQGNSLSGNPRALGDEELIALLRALRDAESPGDFRL
jgi:alcohol dehydrogenase class IV